MKRIMLTIIIIMFVCVLVYLYVPVKFAVKSKKLDEFDKYIIVEVQYSTAALWRVVGDENGSYNTPINATLYGNIPDVNYPLQIGENRFVCFAEYKGDKMMDSGYENAIYNVTSWEILYPINRNGLIPIPSTYLTIADFTQ